MTTPKPKRQSARLSAGTTNATVSPRKFHLPFRSGGGGAEDKRDSLIVAATYRGNELSDSTSQISVAFPTFATPAGVTPSGTIVVEPRLDRRDTADTVDLEVQFKVDGGDSEFNGVEQHKDTKTDDWDDDEPLHVHAVDGRVSDSVDDSDWNDIEDKVNHDSPITDVSKDDFMMTEVESCAYNLSRRASGKLLSLLSIVHFLKQWIIIRNTAALPQSEERVTQSCSCDMADYCIPSVGTRSMPNLAD